MNCKVLISIAQTHINTLQSLKSYSYFFASIALCFSSGAQIGHELDRMFKAKIYFMDRMENYNSDFSSKSYENA